MHAFRLRGLAAGLLVSLALPAAAINFNQMNLVTDDPTVNPAQIVDPLLKNAWGVSFSPSGPFWVSATETDTSPIYMVDPLTQATTKASLTVAVPGGPTGQVFNPNSATSFNGNLFLFVAEDGSVSGWKPPLGSSSELLAPPSEDRNYKGAAFATLAGNSYLYGANFKAGTIDVYKGSAGAPDLTGSFVDPNLPAGYAPFNVQTLGDTLYVAYAVQNEEGDDEVVGAGLGIVDAFDLDGNFITRVATGDTLNAPWGLAIAPASFGDWAGTLLVGNFGDGRINVFDVDTHAFLGQVSGVGGVPLEIDGLWALTPGNDGSAGSSRLLYFSAGPEDEEHGLFGVLIAVPEPSTYALMLLGLGGVALMRARRRNG